MSKARFRRIEVAMWGHRKFRMMSRPEPNGQTLWLFALTTPDTGMIPGIYRSGEASMAEALGWPLGDPPSKAFREALAKGFREGFPEGSVRPFPKTFREALVELQIQGMIHVDSDARLVWIPGALAHNPPGNPNIIRGWRREWKELPDCELKLQAWEFADDFLSKAFAKAFREAFHEACPKPFGKGSPKQTDFLPRIREKREEILKDPPLSPPPGVGGESPEGQIRAAAKVGKARKPKAPSADAVRVLTRMADLSGCRYESSAALEARLRAGVSVEDCLLVVEHLAQDPWWIEKRFASAESPFRADKFPSYLAQARTAPRRRHVSGIPPEPSPAQRPPPKPGDRLLMQCRGCVSVHPATWDGERWAMTNHDGCDAPEARTA